MPRSRASEFQTLERRVRIAKTYCEGKTMAEIAAIEGITIGAIHTHLERIREYWISLMLVDFDKIRSEMLARNDHLESKAWDGYEKSCQDAETIKESTEKGIRIIPAREKGKPPTSKLVPTKHSLEKITQGRSGDPRFLQVISNCLDRRSKLLGLTDDRPVNNVYLDFSSLLAKTPLKEIDVIESVIESTSANSNSNVSDTESSVDDSNGGSDT